MNLRQEFKNEHPETIGETDKDFDNSNYIDWLEQKVRNNIALADVCDNCGRDNVPWGTTDKLWKEISNDPEKSICPQCFVRMAEGKPNYESVIIGFNAELISR